MDGLTGSRATWLAALGAGLAAVLTLVHAVPFFALHALVDGPSLFVIMALVSPVSALVWCWFFVALYREERGSPNAVSLCRVVHITLLLVMLPRLLIFAIQTSTSIFFDAFGIFSIAVAGLSILAWTMLLAMLGFDLKRTHVEGLALFLIILTACQAWGSVNGAVNSLLALFNGSLSAAWKRSLAADGVGGGFAVAWRQLITPGIHFFYWASQILFLIALQQDSRVILPKQIRAEVGVEES